MSDENQKRYDPPYEQNEGPLKKEPEHEGDEHDFENSRVLRNPDLPDVFDKGDDPRGGVERGTESEQGDDDLKGFQSEDVSKPKDH